MVATALCGDVFPALPVLDAHTRIAEFGGDAEGYDEVAEMVLLEADAMRRWLREAPVAGRQVLLEALHEVANNCAMVGAQRCALLTRAVEIQLRNSLRLDVLPAIRAIETELSLMLQELSCRQATRSATAHRAITP
jgi:HPt (histidine-containing phosphotransfer) domain-containing protein